jgi:hypothetical protein
MKIIGHPFILDPVWEVIQIFSGFYFHVSVYFSDMAMKSILKKITNESIYAIQ